MTELLTILALGFFLGMRHATDADHVVAVTTIVSRQRHLGAAALIGLAWGLGHTLTILAVGGAIIFFRWEIPPRVGLSMEFAVALMLIVLGLASLACVFRRIGELARGRDHHSHAHAHGDYVHTHPHQHQPEAHPHRTDDTPLSRLDRMLGSLAPYRLVRPLVVGVVHGLAGSAAVALLVLATLPTSRGALLYLVVFGIGTMAGMMLVTAAVAVPFALSAGRFEAASRGLRVASGLLSVGLGIFLAYRIGIVDGLFTGGASWTPR
ncbi:MAG: hypothetical protein R2882_15480 [Gemmatimonadales bacterium]